MTRADEERLTIEQMFTKIFGGLTHETKYDAACTLIALYEMRPAHAGPETILNKIKDKVQQPLHQILDGLEKSGAIVSHEGTNGKVYSLTETGIRAASFVRGSSFMSLAKVDPNKIDAFKAEIAAVCEKYRIGLVGTCGSEGIYGELTIFNMDDPEAASWVKISEQHLNWE